MTLQCQTHGFYSQHMHGSRRVQQCNDTVQCVFLKMVENFLLQVKLQLPLRYKLFKSHLHTTFVYLPNLPLVLRGNLKGPVNQTSASGLWEEDGKKNLTWRLKAEKAKTASNFCQLLLLRGAGGQKRCHMSDCDV